MEETTKNEILRAINEFANHTEDRFNKIDARFDQVDGRFDRVESRLDRVESRLDKVEATMVTKDYLDDKLSDLRGDLTVLMRKEDTKVKALVEVLKDRKVIT